MRHRYYDFVLVIINAAAFIGYFTFGGEGWVWVAWGSNLGWLRYFTLILQMTAYSPQFTGGDIASSTHGKSFGVTKPLGQKEVEISITTFTKPVPGDDIDSKPVPITVKRKAKVYAWPKLIWYEANTGELGLAKKYGGREQGFWAIDERLLMKPGDKGNIIALAEQWTLTPQTRALVALLRRIKPTATDDRQIVPPEHWTLLKSHKRFSSITSPIHYFVDPVCAIIPNDDLPEATLLLPGKDFEKHAILPIEVRLKDLLGDSPIVDLRPGSMQTPLQLQMENETARAARDWAGKEINKRDEYIQYLESENAKLKQLDDRGRSPGRVEQVVTTIQGPDETSQRLG